ncbi:MAG: fatty acid desaturase family protein [Gemmatimonadaceae bacterium]
MTEKHETQASAAEQPIRSVDAGKRLKFSTNNTFHAALRRQVEDYFRSTGRRQRDCLQMYLKSAVLLVSFATSYLLLVFVAQAWWQALPLALLLGLSTAAIAFNIPHDGGHQAYSNRQWVNKLTAMTLDVLGGSSYLWHQKHAVFHHTYVNITGHDSDIDLGVLGRLTPHQKRFAFHRWQHFYLWPLYGLLAIKWQLFDDFRDIITGRIGEHRFPRPKGWELAIFIGGKVIFFALAFGIPLLFNSFIVVLLFYGTAALVVGMVMSVVFQLAHCVEQADFPLPQEDTGRIENAWAIHQVETTVNFARHSGVVAWLVGGLNFQIEHHLFPKICHVNFPALSKVVEETCREFGVKYTAHKSFWAALASHFRWLRRMGMPHTT